MRSDNDNNVNTHIITLAVSGTPSSGSLNVKNVSNTTVASISNAGALTCTSLTVNGRSSAYTMYRGGRVSWNGSAVVKDFVAASSQSDFTVTRNGVGNYTITFSSGAHPSGANYIVNLTGYTSVVMLRTIAPPTSTSFTIALYSNTSAWRWCFLFLCHVLNLRRLED